MNLVADLLKTRTCCAKQVLNRVFSQIQMASSEFRAIIDGLPSGCTKQDLKDLFEPFGKPVFARITIDKQTGIETGTGRVSMLSFEEVEAATAALNGSSFRNCILKVKPGVHVKTQMKCRSFQTKEGCKFGERCRYLHVGTAEMEGEKVQTENMQTRSCYEYRTEAPRLYSSSESKERREVSEQRENKKYKQRGNVGIQIYTSQYGDCA